MSARTATAGTPPLKEQQRRGAAARLYLLPNAFPYVQSGVADVVVLLPQQPT